MQANQKLNELNNLLCVAAQWVTPQREETIFSIGGRGYYENPTSDIMAFFLNPHEIHGFGALFLESLFCAADLECPSLETITPPQREVYTDDYKRIDILIVGENDIVLIENKIRHWAANPFLSYEGYLNKYHRGKVQHLFLLSPRDESPPNHKWKSIQYLSFLERLQQKAGPPLLGGGYSKWAVFLREFILNIEMECEADRMQEEHFRFVATNYQLICEIQKMAENYFKEVKRRAREAVESTLDRSDEPSVGIKDPDWGKEGKAIQISCSTWRLKSNITFLLRLDASFRIQVYLYEMTDIDVEKIWEDLGKVVYFRYWCESNKTIHCFGYYDCSRLEEALDEIKRVAGILHTYFM